MDAEMDVSTGGCAAVPEPAPGGPAAAAADRLKAERVQQALAAAAELAGRLKAERVQEAFAAGEVSGRLKAERVQEALAAALAGRCEEEGGLQELAQGPRLPAEMLKHLLWAEADGWRASADSRTILRRFKFPLLRAAMAFIPLVGELAATLLHQPEVRLYGNDVLVTFSTPTVNGVTLLDVALARAVNRLSEPPL